MYSYKYKPGKKSHNKKNKPRHNKGLSAGIKKFGKLSIILLLIVPVLYLLDRTITIATNRLSSGISSETFLSGFLAGFPGQYMKIKTIKVSGNKFVSEEALAPYMNEMHDTSIMKADINALMSKLKENAWIKDVTVKRELPSSLLVNIIERMPALYINSNNKLYLADDEGILIGDGTESLLNIPVVYGISLSGIKNGEKVTVEGIESALEVKKELAAIPWIDVSSSGIEVGDRGQITLHQKEYSIRLGKGRYKEKLKRFYELTKNLKDKGNSFTEVDLRFENQVIVKTEGT